MAVVSDTARIEHRAFREARVRSTKLVQSRCQGHRHPWERHHEDSGCTGEIDMPRKKRATPDNPQVELLDVTSKLRTAPCVPALREAVKAWVAGGYKGITATTRILLNYWFYTDHKMPTGAPFKYHRSQQEAMETLIFVWE